MYYTLRMMIYCANLTSSVPMIYALIVIENIYKIRCKILFYFILYCVKYRDLLVNNWIGF